MFKHSLNLKGISFQTTLLPIVSVLSVLHCCISCETTVCPSNSIRKVIQSGQPHWPVILSSKCILLNDNLAKHSIRPTHPIISLSLSPQSTAYSNMLIPFLALSTSGPATSALLKDGERCVYSALLHLYGIQPAPDYRTLGRISQIVLLHKQHLSPCERSAGMLDKAGMSLLTSSLACIPGMMQSTVPKTRRFQHLFQFNQCLNVLKDCTASPLSVFFSSVPFAIVGKEVIAFTNLARGCAVKAICQSESVKLTLGSRYLRLATAGFDILYYT